MAPESGSHLGNESDMDCDEEVSKVENKNAKQGRSIGKEKNFKLLAPYKRNDKFKEILLSKIKVLDDYFTLLGKIGEGTFSTVHLASLKKDPSRVFAVKHLIPTCHPTRIIRELQCLQTIGGQDNVIGVNVCLRSDDTVVFVMPYLPNEKFTNFILKMDAAEVQLYMKNLLLALRRVHSFGIIHRDVKPSNFLYDRENKRFLLIDFGLAQPVDELVPPKEGSKDSSKTDKKRKRSALNENVENTQKKRDEAGETQAAKRPVLRPLITNAPVLKPAVRKKVKQDTANSSIAHTTEPLNGEEKSHLSTRFSASLNLSSMPERTDTRVPKMSVSSDIQPQVAAVNRSEPSCSTQKFQRLAPHPKSMCNRISNFVVQDSQVKEKPGTSGATKNVTTEPGIFPQPTRRAPSTKSVRPCNCAGKSQICNGCMTRRAPNAARAGTPGFRPPEVLLKYQYQTTAVDIWAAGVILISILSGCSPFFRAADDITALAEIMTVFGTNNVKNVATKLGITVLCNELREPYTLKTTCEKLRRRKFQRRDQEKEEDETWQNCPICIKCYCRSHPVYGCVCSNTDDLPGVKFPDEVYDLLKKLLEIDPNDRITAAEALEHPFFKMSL